MKIKTRLRRPLIATARVSAPALIGLGLLGYAVPGTAGAAPATYTAQAKSEGLAINLFGTQLTGGDATAAVNSGTPSASAEGSGTLTPGAVEDQKASANGSGQSQSFPRACAQGGGAPAGSPVGVTVGVSCSSAAASTTDGVPVAAATGEMANLDLNLSSVLNQIISSGGNQLFAGIQQVLAQLNGTPLGTGNAKCPDAGSTSGSTSSTSTGSSGSSSATAPSNPLSSLAGTAGVPGTPLNTLLGSLGLSSSSAASSAGPLGNLLGGLCQTLDNIESVVAGANPPSTVVVDLGPASASVTGTASNTAQASAKGSSAEIQVLPGVGCDASTLTACVTDPSAYAVPLIDIKVGPALATDSWNGTTWAPTETSALASVDLNIPGDAQTISVPGGQSLDLLSGTPLETVIDLGSATAAGANTSNGSGTSNGATLDVAKGVNGGMLLDLGSVSIIGGDSPATPAVAPPAHTNPASPAVIAATPVASPTLVHTGAWWAGSMPYLAGLAVLGGGLLCWPRLRRSSNRLGTLLRAARR